MTRSKRNTILICLSLALAICLGLFLYIGNPRSAKADEDYTNDYSFQSGASVNTLYSDDDFNMALKFNLKVNNVIHRDFLSLPHKQYATNWPISNYSYASDLARFRITLYRDEGDAKEPTPISYIWVFCSLYSDGGTYERTVYSGSFVGGDEQRLRFWKPFDYGSEFNTTNNSLKQYIGKEVELYGHTVKIVDKGVTNKGGLLNAGEEIAELYANVPSPFNNYFLGIEYEYKLCDGGRTGNIFSGYEPTYAYYKGNEKRSDSRSFYYIANAINENPDDDLEYYFEEPHLTKVNEIIREGSVQTVNVKYLKALEGTPFAVPVEQKVSVPVVKGAIYADDVFAYLGVDALKVEDAYAQVFQYDAEIDTYVAYYWKSSWMHAVDSNGHYVDLFFDINQSFEEYYTVYVEKGIITNDLYEWMWDQQVLVKYPQTIPYTPDQLYGLWGVAIIPDTYSLNEFFKEIFQTKTGHGNKVSMFSYEGLITFEEYNELQKAYEYAWIQRAWSAVAGTFTGGTWSAEYYFFYAEPGTSVSWIDKTGEDEPPSTEEPPSQGGIGGGVIGEQVENGWDKITDWIKNPFGKSNWSFTTILLTVGVVVVVVAIIKNVNKNKKSK